MPQAARLGDPIGHTKPGDGPKGGGGGDVTGKIIGPCSGNVFTNGIKAARASIDETVCSKHDSAPLPIATGSPKVFINGLPAARVSDKTACGAFITDGSPNVFIGGGAVQTDPIMPGGIVEEVFQIMENGASLVLGAGEIVVGGFYNSVVRIGAGLASIPYMLDSADAAVGVQKEIAERLNYGFKSDGAKQIGEALKPVGAAVQSGIATARDFSEEKIGLGATAIVFGGVEAGVEIAGVVTGGRALKSFIDLPLPGATKSAIPALQKADGIPPTGIAALDAPATASSSFAQKMDALRRAGYQVTANPELKARGEFSPGKVFEYNPLTMTRLDMSHEWRHFNQLQQMEAKGIKLNSSAFKTSQGPAELGAYNYEARLWNRAGASPTKEYLEFHNKQLGVFEEYMGAYRREAAGKYGVKWRGIKW